MDGEDVETVFLDTDGGENYGPSLAVHLMGICGLVDMWIIGYVEMNIR